MRIAQNGDVIARVKYRIPRCTRNDRAISYKKCNKLLNVAREAAMEVVTIPMEGDNRVSRYSAHFARRGEKGQSS